MDPKEHWNAVYRARPPEQLGWYQAHPEISLRLIAESGTAKDAALIDVGGGASLLVDRLVADGYSAVTVLDVSAAALAAAQARLGEGAQAVTWLEADATRFTPPQNYALWHDRAVFHFLTGSADRQAYLRAVKQALPPGGQLVIATFAADGPEKCSNLPVVRYSPQQLADEVGDGFELLESCGETHTTPWDVKQSFTYCRFRRR